MQKFIILPKCLSIFLIRRFLKKVPSGVHLIFPSFKLLQSVGTNFLFFRHFLCGPRKSFLPNSSLTGRTQVENGSYPWTGALFVRTSKKSSVTDPARSSAPSLGWKNLKQGMNLSWCPEHQGSVQKVRPFCFPWKGEIRKAWRGNIFWAAENCNEPDPRFRLESN